MRVIDAEKLDTYLTDVIRTMRDRAFTTRRRGGVSDIVVASNVEVVAITLSEMADRIADMSQEGTIYLTQEQSSDMDGGRISPLHTIE